MPEVFKQFLTQMPVWVGAMLAYLIFSGVKARRPGQTSMLKLALVPAVFTAWGAIDLIRLYGLEPQSLSLWLAGLAFGVLIGWRLLTHADIHAGRAAGVISHPADFTLLPLLLITFAVKYTFGVIAATSPDLLQQTGARLADLLLSGTFTGKFICFSALIA